MPERRKRPRDPSDVPQIFRGGRGYTVYRVFNSRREGVMHRLMYDEGTEQCINKCDKNRNMWVSHLSQRPRSKLKRDSAVQTCCFPEYCVCIIAIPEDLKMNRHWKWLYLRLKARRQNKLGENRRHSWKRNDTVRNMTECTADSLQIREHFINFNLSK